MVWNNEARKRIPNSRPDASIYRYDDNSNEPPQFKDVEMDPMLQTSMYNTASIAVLPIPQTPLSFDLENLELTADYSCRVPRAHGRGRTQPEQPGQPRQPLLHWTQEQLRVGHV